MLSASLRGFLRFGLALGVVWGVGELRADSPPSTTSKRLQFNRDIRPILSEACLHCHGPDASRREADLRLDRGEDAHRRRQGKAAVVAGRPAESELIRRITATDPDERMPPRDAPRQLTPEQIDTLRRWIEQGGDYQPHWSLVPVRSPSLPPVRDRNWARRPLDLLVQASLEARGWSPSPPADPATLVRRLALDLTGLPPDAQQVESFLVAMQGSPAEAERAYEQLVDQLLASPRFGERMAVPWLDAARYADTNGYQTDGPRQMWRWRDALIEALNGNQPFDQFTLEQLAGDLLPNATMDQRIASGFHRNHRGNAEGGIIPEEFRIEYVVDRVETTATVWLGLTLGCARCHDHKYDPFTQREFYQLFAFFNNVPELGKVLRDSNSPPLIVAPTRDMLRERATFDARRDALAQQIAAREPVWQRQQTDWEERARRLRRLFPWTWSQGQVDHLPLDEPTEGEKIIGGAVRRVEGVIGQAVELDGRALLELGDRGQLSETARSSLGVWVWPATSRSGTIVSRMEDDFNRKGWALGLEAGKLQFHLSNRTLDDALRVETIEPLDAEQWQHVLVTFDGSSLAQGVTIYVDGQRRPTRVLLDLLSNVIKNEEPLRLGAGLEGDRFAGRVDDVQFFDRELTAEQAQLVACGDSIDRILAIEPARRTQSQRGKLRAYFLAEVADPADRDLLRAWDTEAELRWEFEHRLPTVMVMEELAEPRPTHVLIRGEYDKPGERVAADVPGQLPPLPSDAPRNRLTLARWLVSPNHPLTARVAVNRWWQLFFGQGLVKTSEDFGVQGEPPSHPELLDHLSASWMAHEWDVKWLVREIVTSATYRQTSRVERAELQRDPENRWLSRGSRFRLPADVVRDQALASAGLLVERVGGPSVRPYQPPGLWEEVASSGTVYVTDQGADLFRRSVYTFWKRTVPPPGMMTFDAAGREACVVRTARTNTPLQALALLNDVTYVEAARGLAEQSLLGEPSGGDESLRRAFRRLLVREPTDAELASLRRLRDRAEARFRAEPAAAERFLQVGAMPRNPWFDPAKLAAMASVCNVLLNLDEVLTRE